MDSQTISKENDHKATFSTLAAVYRVSTHKEFEALSNMKEQKRKKLLKTLEEGITTMRRGGKIDHPDTVFDAMLILAHLREAAAFPHLLTLTELNPSILDDTFGEYFLFEDLPRLLTATAHGKWDKIEERIHGLAFEDCKHALLDALERMALDRQVPREHVIELLKCHFNNILKQDLEADKHLGMWVSTASNLWPGECLEEIKELYGLRFVDEEIIGIDAVLKDYRKGLEGSFIENQKRYSTFPFVLLYDEAQQKKENSSSQKLDKAIERMRRGLKYTDDLELDIENRSVGRNDPCPCGSGKKHKRCCLHSKQKNDIRLEKIKITWEPVDNDYFEEEDQICLETLYMKLHSNPQECIHPLLELHNKYPENPSLYNYLYTCYVYTERLREAHELLLKTMELFPDYLFGLVEYGHYLLRRGDYDRIMEVFRGCKSLKQLYPGRDVFHISEAKSFYSFMVMYYLAVDNMNQANIHLSALEQIDPDCEQTQSLRDKIIAHKRRKLCYQLLMNE